MKTGVLALDTSTECCSAALLLPDGRVILRDVLTERSHAELILPMIDEVLAEAGVKLDQLDGLAFGRGPGGFTGVRVAAGVVQGLAYGAGLKVAPVSSLAAVAVLTSSPLPLAGEVVRSTGEGASRSAPSPDLRSTSPTDVGEVLICNDARMGEVYWAVFAFDAETGLPVARSSELVSPPERVEPSAATRMCAGNGISRHPALRARLEAAGLQLRDGLYPRADAVARIGAVMLAHGLGVEPADAQPVYVRDDVARPSAGAVTRMS